MGRCHPSKGKHMTHEDIIRMAREVYGETDFHESALFHLTQFAALVAAAARAEEREQGQKWFDAVLEQHKIDVLAERSAGVKAEREACARMVEDDFDFVGDELIIAEAIRARGQA